MIKNSAAEPWFSCIQNIKSNLNSHLIELWDCIKNTDNLIVYYYTVNHPHFIIYHTSEKQLIYLNILFNDKNTKVIKYN